MPARDSGRSSHPSRIPTRTVAVLASLTLGFAGVAVIQAASASGAAGENRAVVTAALPGRSVRGTFLTGPRSGHPLPNAVDFFFSRRGQWGLGRGDLAGYRVSSSYTDHYNGVTHVYLQQRYRGIDVLGAVASINVARDGSIINLDTSFVPDLAQRVNTLLPVRSAAEGVSASLSALRLKPERAVRTLGQPRGVDREVTVSGGGVSTGPVPAQLVYVPIPSGALRLAWNTQIQEVGGAHWWDAAVDAVTSKLLVKTDWVSHADDSYNVFAPPLESPRDGLRSVSTSPADPLASPNGWLDTNGQPGPDTTVTDGNNVHAFTDVDGNNVPDPGSEADGGSNLSFDFPLDLSQDPSTYGSAAVTNLFYWNNYLHDVSYRYGFDEAAGNFQRLNYSGRGAGGDAVDAAAQVGAAINNSTFVTPPDGRAPLMQMFLWRPPLPAGTLSVTAPSAIASTVPAGRAAYGPDTSAGDVSGRLQMTPDPVLCTDQSGTYGQDYLRGIVAAADRGTCSFKTKTLNAQRLGAAALVIFNDRAGNPPQPGDDPSISTPITIPTLTIGLADAQAIKDQLNANVEVDVTVTVPGPLPAVDGDLDNGIISHEYMHGISTRLTGGSANSSCLTNAEQQGEGWSDFMALVMNAYQGDSPSSLRPIGAYVNGGNGIRPTPYTTDMTVDPATYDSLQQFSDPHDVGYVWASMLWDMYWNLVGAHGFAPIKDHDLSSGNAMALQLVLDGMKLQPCNPGFVDARNAILSADQVDNGGQNQCLIWRAFAQRGLGVSALQRDPNVTNDGTAAFDVPAACAPSITFSTTPAAATGGGGAWFNAGDLAPLGSLSVTATALASAQSQGLQSISCTVDGVTSTSSSGSLLTTGLTDGSHTISCTATDREGFVTPVAASATYRIDTVAPTVSFTDCPTGPVASGSSAVIHWKATDAGSGVNPAAGSVSLDTSVLGARSVSSGSVFDTAGNAASATCSYTVTQRSYTVSAFGPPVDGGGVLNKAKAGQSVPFKFRVTDAQGVPVTTLTSATSSAVAYVCESGVATDAIEEYATGDSGLQNLGNGNYQFNFKTPKTWAGSCRTLGIRLDDGINHTADFKFVK